MVTRKFGVHFHSGGGALTLPVSAVSELHVEGGEHTRTHGSGWTITGQVHEDYYTWVNDFNATHPTFGRVWGNFENQVKATSKAAFDHFYANHEPEAWDYADI